MTLKQFIEELKKIKEELQSKDIVIISKNGLFFPPKIKFKLRDKPLQCDKNNGEKIIISY